MLRTLVRFSLALSLLAAFSLGAFGQAITIQQSTTSRKLVFLMIDSSDHVTGKTGLTVTVTFSKNGAAFGAAAGAVTEIGSGWYAVAGNATDSNTLGSLALHATATGADPSDKEFNVVAFNPDSATNLGLSALPTATAGANGGLPLGDASGRVDVGKWLGSAPDALSSGKLPADVKLWLASAPAALSTNGYVQAMVLRWLTDNAGGTPNALISGRTDANTQATAAALTFGLTGNITGNLSGSVGSVTGAVGSVTGAVGSVTGAVGSVTGNIGGISGVTLPGVIPSLAQIEAGILVTSSQPIATDASGRVILQPTQTGVTIPTVTTLTNAPSDTSGTTTLLSRIPGTVSPQTGDSYARLGAPAGASISADIAANLTAINTRAATSALPTNFSALSITAGGLVAINLAQAIGASPWDATTVGDAFKAAWVQGVGKWVINGATLTLYAPDGTTTLKSFTISPTPTANASRQ